MAVTSLADRNSMGIRTEEVENIDDGAQAEQIPVKDKLVGEVNRDRMTLCEQKWTAAETGHKETSYTSKETLLDTFKKHDEVKMLENADNYFQLD